VGIVAEPRAKGGEETSEYKSYQDEDWVMFLGPTEINMV
jgi:hypothetical protein